MLWPDTRKITDVVVPYFQVLGDFFIIITKVGIDEQSEILFHQALGKASVGFSRTVLHVATTSWWELVQRMKLICHPPWWWQWLGLEVPDSFSHSWLRLFQWLSQSSGLATRKDLNKHHLSLKEGERPKEVGGQRKLFFFILDECSLVLPKVRIS